MLWLKSGERGGISPPREWFNISPFQGGVGVLHAVAAGNRPQGKNADLKSVITTIIRNNYNDNNVNSFKMVCSQSLLHNEQMQVIFKHTTQQTFRTLIDQRHTSQIIRTNKLLLSAK